MKNYLCPINNLIKKMLQIHMIQNIIAIMGAIIIGFILGKNIPNATTVWELGDEAGYLSNAVYFLGKNWDDVRAEMPYFAYGYSVFLIPIYLITNTGVQLIQGAMYINLLFAIGTYFLIIYFLEKVGRQENRIITSAISFATCLNSYLCCNVLKVNCESLCVFWYCLTALILYKTIQKRKTCYFVLLGIICSYLFFIHTRMIVIVLALMFTLFISFWLHNLKDYFIRLLVFLGTFLVFFISLYLVKNSIVKYASALNTASNAVQGNLIDGNYILNRITWLFMPENLKLYVLSFISKIFYVIIVSSGTILFGYTNLCKSIFQKQLNNDTVEAFSVKLFFLLGMTFMIITCTINGAGLLENYCYFFYSRYYENTLIPVIAFSVLGVITTKWNSKIYFKFIIVAIIVGITTSILKIFLYTENIWIDTARIPGFSWLVNNATSYQNMIFWGTIIITLAIVIYLLCSRFKVKTIIILLIVCVMTWKSTSLGIERINGAHINSKPDTEIAAQILGSEDYNTVYMIDDESYKFPGYYSRMQVLLKDIPLKVIHKDELEQIDKLPKDTWILTYTTTVLRESYLLELTNVMKGTVFELWKK